MFKDWKILIVGAGTMGSGIAQLFASKGFQVILSDKFSEQLVQAKERISNNVDNLIKEGLATQIEAEKAKTLISYETDLTKCASQANLVVESIFENADAKREIFSQLDKLCTSDCIFCSNTSASNIFEIAQVSHPERLLITHFFNPPVIMGLVEVVMGPKTSDETLDKVNALLTQLGKDPAVIKKYIPGFIVNRIATAITREAGYMVTEGWTTAQDIDRALRNTSGIRYAFEGPMALYDIVGWDLTTSVSKDIHKTLCNDTEVNSLGKELVAKGDLGLKSGKGVFDYTSVDPQQFLNERSAKIIKMIKAVKEL
ncbi:3-hydroxyacyl-CoA dehydrogenase family protein [Sporomusa sp. KB1]|jgi:3-hydroxybutyryl-CoA dehydrogenase|uniref:3-hydroxyacyl-CoA dehydrogenase family protein n=1 Tax=Sporomusa sp. KB1 TaxID=943346 RepID=UPI0011A28BB0|nr:3-hydroxyacyl-CoA dehydrogenase family protein [Sporomusa sp. KB1]TWH47132.1 3-hydroxybutyryl-CoA dehydrogenase [Sporomusa sp. KB1]